MRSMNNSMHNSQPLVVNLVGSPEIESTRRYFLLALQKELLKRNISFQTVFSKRVLAEDPISSFQDQFNQLIDISHNDPPSVILLERSIIEYELYSYPERGSVKSNFFMLISERFRNIKMILNKDSNKGARDLCNKYDLTFYEVNEREERQVADWISTLLMLEAKMISDRVA